LGKIPVEVTSFYLARVDTDEESVDDVGDLWGWKGLK
jgi:hypothetical protein